MFGLPSLCLLACLSIFFISQQPNQRRPHNSVSIFSSRLFFCSTRGITLRWAWFGLQRRKSREKCTFSPLLLSSETCKLGKLNERFANLTQIILLFVFVATTAATIKHNFQLLACHRCLFLFYKDKFNKISSLTSLLANRKSNYVIC